MLKEGLATKAPAAAEATRTVHIQGGSGSCGCQPAALGGQRGQWRGQYQPKQEGIRETKLDEEGRESKKTAREQSKSCLSATLGGCQRGPLQAGQRVRGEAEEQGLAKEGPGAPEDNKRRGQGSAVQGPARGKRSWPLEELKLVGSQFTRGERERALLRVAAGWSPFRRINGGGEQSRTKKGSEKWGRVEEKWEWAQMAEY